MGFSVCHINIRSLTAHFNDFLEYFSNYAYDVVSVSETWLKPYICDSEIELPGYTLVRRDRLGCIYKPPSTNTNEFLNYFEDELIDLLPKYDTVICMGDFNIDLFDTSNTVVSSYNNILESAALNQIINEPTRISKTGISLIDHIIVSNHIKVSRSGTESLDLSDHEMVFAIFEFLTKINKPRPCQFRSLKNINIQLLTDHLCSIPWRNMYDYRDVDEMVAFFNENLTILMDIHAPLKVINFNKHYRPWITENIKTLIKIRNKAKTKYNRTKLIGDYESYKTLRNFVTKIINKEKRIYLQRSSSGNGKDIWKFLKTLNANVSETDVSKILFGIKSKAVGYDGIPIDFLVLCCPFILKYICHIINFCLRKSVFPASWKVAQVIPHPKVVNPSSYADLRPVSILPVLSKILENVIKIQLVNHIENNNILPDTQSGFRVGHSCTTALLNVTDHIFRSINEDKFTLLVLLDYSKAFDALNHKALTKILEHIGLTSSAVDFFRQYLNNRKQFVKLENQSSSCRTLTRGVPQGSILGPILFNIYTAIFPKFLTYCKSQMYADDFQLFYSFPKHLVKESCDKINYDLKNIYRISHDHSLTLSPNKCVAMLFGSSKYRKDITNMVDIKINNVTIPVKSEAKNLGLILDNNLRFQSHAVVVLHNYCQTELSHDYCPPNYVDTEGMTNGGWRDEQTSLTSVGRLSTNVSRREFYENRNILADYLVSDVGKVSWQEQIIDSGLLLN
ncbi:uncharacterized protein LOC115885127 [Sitophilus oryzae]|uniref:Uncharacterized protein LOC115885127 n=1 Tax=Sitophilus oryzae TaxID=7048 RepID=A0A6J2YA28_SITOR|nr:uncharacterized protein LOC115885127 [Sitophilus oryzae]